MVSEYKDAQHVVIQAAGEESDPYHGRTIGDEFTSVDVAIFSVDGDHRPARVSPISVFSAFFQPSSSFFGTLALRQIFLEPSAAGAARWLPAGATQSPGAAASIFRAPGDARRRKPPADRSQGGEDLVPRLLRRKRRGTPCHHRRQHDYAHHSVNAIKAGVLA